MNKFWRFAAAASFLFSNPGATQNLEEAQIHGQPLVYMKEGRIDGCGVRLFSVKLDPAEKIGTAWDVSFNLWVSGAALVKGMTYDFDVTAMKRGIKPRNAHLDRFSIKAPNQQATQPTTGKVVSGEDVGSLLYQITFDSALGLLKSVLSKEQLTVSVRRKGERTDRLYFGSVILTNAEGEQVLRCLSEATQNIKMQQ